MKPFRSLRWRLVASYLVLSAGAVLLVGLLSLALIYSNARQRELAELQTQAAGLARQVAARLAAGARQEDLDELADQWALSADCRVTILDYERRVLAEAGPLPVTERMRLLNLPGPGQVEVLFADPGAGGPVTTAVVGIQDGTRVPLPVAVSVQEPPRSERSVTYPVGGDAPLGYVTLSQGLDRVTPALYTARTPFLTAMLVTLLAAVLVGLVMARSLTRPLAGLMRATRQMGGADLTARARVDSQDEFGLLAGQFNGMAGQLEASFAELHAERDTLRRFIADASHELRTPITALHTFNELLLGPAEDDPAARRDFLLKSQAQVERLEWITRNLLDLARLEGGMDSLEIAACDGVDLLAAALWPHRPAAEEKGLRLELQPPPGPVTFPADRRRLDLALSNLIGNAVKFTPPGGLVTVGLEAGPGSVCLWVRDTGPGISEADLPHIFDRFYRGRGESAAGSGLGLAIVAGVARAHGGRVRVASRPGEGSTFTLELPA